MLAPRVNPMGVFWPGQHSLAFLLLRSGYRLELERFAPLDMALQARRWDLVDLLVEWGADRRSCSVLNFDAVAPLRRAADLEGLEQAGARWLSLG